MVIQMSQPKTYHAGQGAPEKTVTGNDIQFVTQPNANGLEGYVIGKTTISVVSQFILDTIKTNGGLGIAPFDRLNGIKGIGTNSSPIRINSEYLKNKWVAAQGTHVSQVGDLNMTTLPIVAGSGFAINITTNIFVLLGGISATIVPQTLNIGSYYGGSLSNTTLYLYLEVINNQLAITISNSVRSDTFNLAYTGTITTNGTGIASITAKPFTRINNYRLSDTIMGGALPVSTGSPNQVQFTTWGGQGTIAPVNAGIDTTQYTGSTTFNRTDNTVTIDRDGQFFIKNKALAIEQLDHFYQVAISAGVNGAMGYLNGNAIWKGKGSSNAIVERDNLLLEGWNTVHIEWGSITIRGPFLK